MRLRLKAVACASDEGVAPLLTLEIGLWLRTFRLIMKHRFVFLLLLCLATVAQVQAQFYVGVHGGLTLPEGIYSESRMSDNGWMFTEGHQWLAGAGKGWSAGVDMSFAMPFHPSLELVLSAEYMQSGVNKDVKDYYDYIYRARYSNCAKYSMQLPKFRNIPVLLGVRYAYPVTKGIDFYGEVLAGINVRHISDWTLSYASGDWSTGDGQQLAEYNNEDRRVYEKATTFAFRVGAGFLFKKKVTVGADFNILGPSPLVWDRTSTIRYSVYGEMVEHSTTQHVVYSNLNPVMVRVHVGFRLAPFKTRTVQDW